MISRSHTWIVSAAHLLYSVLLTVVNPVSSAQRARSWTQEGRLPRPPAADSGCALKKPRKTSRGHTQGSKIQCGSPAARASTVEASLHPQAVRGALCGGPHPPPPRMTGPGGVLTSAHFSQIYPHFWVQPQAAGGLGHCLTFAGGVLIEYALMQKFLLSFLKKYTVF